MSAQRGTDRHSTLDLDGLAGRARVHVGDGQNDRLLSLKPGDVTFDLDIGPQLVLVPPGRYRMGSDEDDEGIDFDVGDWPAHEVTIAYPLLVGRFPVTFAEWDAAQTHSQWQTLSGRGSRAPADRGWGRERRPVIDVNWRDAKGYAAWLSLLTGKSYRLLSEAEWEYCCRAGSKTLYSFGNVITTDDANYSPDREHSATGTIEVGRHAANAFGLYDMHGNVCEWCEDAWHDGYDGAPTGGSAWIGGSSDRVVRGGCWNDYARRLRASDRWPVDAGDRSHWVGFRVARDVVTGGER